MLLRRFASVMAGGALALTSYGVMVGAPASAKVQPSGNTVEITKVVDGTSKGAGFTVEVTCTGETNKTFTLVFPSTGGTKSATGIENDSTCTVVETGDGGASNVTVSGENPCVFEEPIEAAAVIPVPEFRTCEVTVTNTFAPPAAGPAGPAGPPGPPGEAAAAPAVVARARFTG